MVIHNTCALSPQENSALTELNLSCNHIGEVEVGKDRYGLPRYSADSTAITALSGALQVCLLAISQYLPACPLAQLSICLPASHHALLETNQITIPCTESHRSVRAQLGVERTRQRPCCWRNDACGCNQGKTETGVISRNNVSTFCLCVTIGEQVVDELGSVRKRPGFECSLQCRARNTGRSRGTVLDRYPCIALCCRTLLLVLFISGL